MRTDLDRFFSPKSIAVIGASQDLSTISGQPLKFLQSHGYPGRLYPVNPRYREILGVACYPALADLPEVPDLALILVNAARVADVLTQCGAKGVPYVIIFSSGFAEMGGEGERRQVELVEIARRHRIGVIGPNCQGMIDVGARVFAGFGSVFNSDYDPGAVSMVSQSGGFGYTVMNLMSKDGGLPVRRIVTTGNEIGVSTLDFIDHYIRDPETGIIAAYVEGLKDARRLLDVGDRALLAGKPIVMWKVGNTEQGQTAVRSHTANPPGATALYKAAFRQRGIIQAEDIQDVIDYGRAFRCGRLPRGNRLAMITISGGAGILMTDECLARGMQVPQLAPETTQRLRAFVPEFASLVNPVDVTAAIFNQTDLVGRTLDAVLGDPNVDCVAMINASLQGELAVKVAAEIVAGASRSDKPVFLAWGARDAVSSEPYAMLDAAGIPHYKSPVRCGRAIAALAWYAEARRRRERERGEPVLALSGAGARAALAAGSAELSGDAAKRVLAEYGIPVHGADIATGGVEVIAGITNDSRFGPAVRFALGGLYAEVLADAAYRLAPVTRSDAREMIREIAGYPALARGRGRPPADVDALADVIVRLSALALDLEDRLAELEINPLIVLPAGQGVIAADASIRPMMQ